MRRLGSILITAAGILAICSLILWYVADEVKVDGEPHADAAARIGLIGFAVALLIAALGALLRRRATLADRRDAPLSRAADQRP